LNPFWRKDKTSEVEMKTREPDHAEKTANINEFHLYGPSSCSPNGRYVLRWYDGDRLSGKGGFRESGDGRYSLLEDSRIILEGRMQRPNDGHVANDGSFVICDWMFGEGTKGTFYAMDKAGSVLIKESFNSNLLNCAISTEGKYAVCQTCNSDNEDSRKLSLFDLANGTRLFCTEPPESLWANEYEIAPLEKKVYLIYKDFGRFAYSFSGEFLDEEIWSEENIKRATGVELARIARQLWAESKNKAEPEKTNKILSLMSEALIRGMFKYPNEMAKVYRDIGEIYESLNQKEKALESLRKSLSIDPKAGVKRSIDRLSKDVGTTVASVCPHCNETLSTAPKRKSKCPKCGNEIFVRNRPGSPESVLVTEEEANRIDEEWTQSKRNSSWLRSLERYGLSEENFKIRRQKNLETNGSNANDRDILWGFLNELTTKTEDEWKLGEIYYMMALFLDEEQKEFFFHLQQSKRWILKALKAGECKHVRIFASKNACAACRALDGKTMPINEALSSLPIPCAHCTSKSSESQKGFCRCRYDSLEGTVIGRYGMTIPGFSPIKIEIIKK
jgi:tetratricopeptide (TPR) repeat protein